MALIEVRTRQGRKRIDLPTGPLTIGRSDDNILVLEDDRASRHHCVIEPMEGNDDSCFQLRDLGSRNGTKLNNEDVDIQPLDNGDVVRIGGTEIRFIDPEQTFTHKRSNVPNFSTSMDDVDSPLDSNIPTLDIDLHADAAGGVQTGYERRLREMAVGGVERGFDETDISLVDTKGVTLHQATSSGIESGNDDEAGESIRALRLLLFTSFRVRATDLHVEPKIQGSTIRLRVDGYMINAVDISETLFKRLLGLIKILCQIETSQKNTVQDGHFSVAVKGRRVDYRVSLTPSVHGQKLVIRVLDSQNAPSRLHELGCLPWQYEKLRSIATKDAGLLLACGPTGSGKTTTLYSCIREIDVEQRNAITIEDPVEYYLDGCTQIPVDSDQGNSFGSILRSVLRQDPDVIFVGEIRDIETATVAMQASMTGHLVYTTVHAKDSIGSIFRLLDLGVEAFLVANALNLIVAQRLVRLLCPSCRKGVTPTPAQNMKMGQSLGGVPEIFVPTGCKQCLRTGFIGRRALFELLEVTDAMRDVIMKTPTIQGIRQIAKQGLFTSLEEYGFHLVSEGETTFEEIDRVAGTE
ncbi:MAG: ATPase, T2SS/T4P/T4SS family [Planctomycetota bacterium]|nr:ATPase, T2SS/T4P/T4SS family [Planctomycetota bacterium]